MRSQVRQELGPRYELSSPMWGLSGIALARLGAAILSAFSSAARASSSSFEGPRKPEPIWLSARRRLARIVARLEQLRKHGAVDGVSTVEANYIVREIRRIETSAFSRERGFGDVLISAADDDRQPRAT